MTSRIRVSFRRRLVTAALLLVAVPIWIRWRVTDTGIGIRAEDQSKLFQPFSQVDESARRRFGGTGLGLALTAEICRLMSARVTVESEWQKGSEFTIWLPDGGR